MIDKDKIKWYNSCTVKRKPRLLTRGKRGETQKNASVSGTYSIAF